MCFKSKREQQKYRMNQIQINCCFGETIVAMAKVTSKSSNYPKNCIIYREPPVLWYGLWKYLLVKFFTVSFVFGFGFLQVGLFLLYLLVYQSQESKVLKFGRLCNFSLEVIQKVMKAKLSKAMLNSGIKNEVLKKLESRWPMCMFSKRVIVAKMKAGNGKQLWHYLY